MSYTPNPYDTTQPTADKFVFTAAAEFRALKALVASAVTADNYAGDWSSLTGALAVGKIVSHSGGLWFLVNPLADVTASEPGVTADWVELGGVRRTGDTMTGPLEVPAGATGAAVPQAQEVVGKTDATGSAILPYGTSVEQDASPDNGYTRVNSDYSALEFYIPTGWKKTGISMSAVVDANTGTEHSVTGIPAWATRVTLWLADVSTTGSANILVRAGTSAGLIDTGYTGMQIFVTAGGNTTLTTAIGFGIQRINANDEFTGKIEFVRQPGTGLWFVSGQIARYPGPTNLISGYVTLADDLDRLGIVRGGTDTFDGGGKIWATWEG